MIVQVLFMVMSSLERDVGGCYYTLRDILRRSFINATRSSTIDQQNIAIL